MSLQTEIAQVFPKYERIIMARGEASDSTWQASISTGKALEFISLLMILQGLEELEAIVSIDRMYWDNPDYFYLRNEIPFHHGAQAGHTGSLNELVPLSDRFYSALMPRVTILYNGKKYLLFREGNPLHLIFRAIQFGETYKDRPDMVLIAGEIDVALNKPTSISYTHKDNSESAVAELSIKNTNLLPVTDYDCSADYEVRTLGVVECSVSKSESHVDNQLNGYIKLFLSSYTSPETLFIHGSRGGSAHRTLNIDFNNLAASISSPRTRLIITSFLTDSMK
jgi:hypothetical protein